MPSSDRSREDTLVVPHLTSPSTNTFGRRRSHAVKNLQMILNERVTAYMRASILAYWRMLLRRGCRLKTVRQAWSQKARLLPMPPAATTAKAIPADRAENTICTCRLHMRPWRRPNILDYALGPSRFRLGIPTWWSLSFFVLRHTHAHGWLARASAPPRALFITVCPRSSYGGECPFCRSVSS